MIYCAVLQALWYAAYETSAYMRGSTLLYFQNVTFPKFFYVLIMREKIGDFSEFKAYCFIQRFV